MKPRLVIIGDSFARPSYREEDFYGHILQKMIPDIEVRVDGEPSRDIQTIIDHWIKILPELTENDYLIVVIPYFGRTRLPIHKDHWGSYKVGETEIIKRFVGTPSYNSQNVDIEFYGKEFTREYFMELLKGQEIILSGNASECNFLEIISSLKKITRPKSYVFTWDYVNNPGRTFDNKPELAKKMGGWETLHNDFINTNGAIGKEHDSHWSPLTHTLFSDFIIKEFGLNRKII
jgi:hypothetical protein